MAAGAEGLFVHHLTGDLWLTWGLHRETVAHELFIFNLRELERLLPSALSCVSFPEVITQIAATAAEVMVVSSVCEQ